MEVILMLIWHKINNWFGNSRFIFSRSYLIDNFFPVGKLNIYFQESRAGLVFSILLLFLSSLSHILNSTLKDIAWMICCREKSMATSFCIGNSLRELREGSFMIYIKLSSLSQDVLSQSMDFCKTILQSVPFLIQL